MKLTKAHLDALEAVQFYYTNKWRQRVEFIWSTGMWAPALADHRAALQQLRNQLGLAWLKAYRPGDEQVGWLATARYEAPCAGGYRWRNGYRIAHADGLDMIQPYCANKTEVRALARSLKITLLEDQP